MHERELVDVEVVTEGLEFPEGPVALADGSVIVGEIAAGRVTRVDSDGTKDAVVVVGGGPNGLAIGADGALYVCNNGGFRDRIAPCIQRIDLARGECHTLYEHCDGESLQGPNDIVFDHTGNFWFTDMRRGEIFYAAPDGSSIRRMITGLLHPNGIGLSPDGSVLYWAQTHTRQLLRRKLEASGVPADSPGHDIIALIRSGAIDPFALMVGMPGMHEFDSLAVDSGGSVCVATLIDSGITEVPPEGGLANVTLWRLPDHLADAAVTNIAFGGPARTRAYITCSISGRLVSATWPRPGLQLAF